LQVETQTFQTAPSLQSANPTQSYSRSGDKNQVSRSVVSHEAKAKLKIACLDSNSNFAVFTKSKFIGTQKQNNSLINKYFWIVQILYYNILAKKVVQLQNLCTF